MAAESQLAALRTVTAACQVAVWSFSDEQAAEGLAFADYLRALFLPPQASRGLLSRAATADPAAGLTRLWLVNCFTTSALPPSPFPHPPLTWYSTGGYQYPGIGGRVG